MTKPLIAAEDMSKGVLSLSKTAESNGVSQHPINLELIFFLDLFIHDCKINILSRDVKVGHNDPVILCG